MRSIYILLATAFLVASSSTGSQAAGGDNISASFDRAFADSDKVAKKSGDKNRKKKTALASSKGNEDFFYVRISFVKMLGESLTVKKEERRNISELAHLGWEEYSKS